VDQLSGTTPADASVTAQDDSRAADTSSSVESPGFAARGRMRRRARFLRKARELAYRDLGGLVFNLHRFGQRNDALVMAKLNTLGHIDAELRRLEGGLNEHHPVTVLREAGITACARCAAIHSSEDSFCPNCGLSLGRNADLPIAGAAGPSAGGPASAAEASAAAAQPATTTPEPAASEPTPTQAYETTPAPAQPGQDGSNGAPGSQPAAAEASEPAADRSGAAPAPARTQDPAPRPGPRPAATGRSPTPRSTRSAPTPSAPAPADEEESTEILRPHSPGK
jgi:hypothetical protein